VVCVCVVCVCVCVCVLVKVSITPRPTPGHEQMQKMQKFSTPSQKVSAHAYQRAGSVMQKPIFRYTHKREYSLKSRLICIQTLYKVCLESIQGLYRLGIRSVYRVYRVYTDLISGLYTEYIGSA
jgi:hypothetical protein